MAKQKEAIENLLKILQKWQKVEDDSIRNTNGIIKKTQNPLVQIIMEIIQQDSAMHRRVQQLIIDHFTKQSISINPDEIATFWDMVEEHDRIEKRTINMAEAALAETKSPIARYLLDYLMTDEKKHDKLLEEMGKIKSSMYPYGGY